jgi:RecB family exonuclease
VLARGTRLAVIGLPCGDREPSPWLPALAAQLGLDLAKERARAGAEAAPGAPLGPVDSLGEHESALWRPVGRPRFVFRLPPRRAGDLGIAASRLNDLLRDPFAFALSRLGIDPPLSATGRRGDGEELHDLLEKLTARPPERWEHELPDLLDNWIERAADPFARAARARAVEGIAKAVGEEAALMPGWSVAADRQLEIRIAVGAEELLLRNEADRIDLGSDGTARIVDWKFQRVTDLRRAVRERREGQLVAYAEGLRQRGLRVEAAHYRALLDGDAAGYAGGASARSLGREPGQVGELPERVAEIVAAIARLAAGEAATDPEDGLCGQRGYAPIARIDEARLDLTPGDGEEGE